MTDTAVSFTARFYETGLNKTIPPFSMSTLFVVFATFFGYIIAYHTYGRFIGRKLFGLTGDETVPSVEKRDDIDFVPTNRYILFGHHFTSIAGTGPIVGPAIAVLWGWLPALLWVIFGSIFVGAVHDFVALILSVRNQGQTLGEIAGKVLSPTAKPLVLLLLGFLLALVLAVFGNIIATLFEIYPECLLPVWISLPIAMILGLMVHRWNVPIFVPSLVALAILYFAVYLGAYVLPPLKLHGVAGVPFLNTTMLWTFILLVYCFVASVLPVWLLLQPRDYINSYQLYVAMGMVVAGLFYAAVLGRADMVSAAPMLRSQAELTAIQSPPLLPFLFITVACGAASGFHALVASGTSSKQIATTKDAQFIGYGAMILEGALAVLVIIACTAGVGMGTQAVGTEVIGHRPEAIGEGLDVMVGIGNQVVVLPPSELHITPFTLESNGMLTGRAAWEARYSGSWSSMKLGQQVAIFIEGSSNFLEGIGLPPRFAHSLMAVMIVCFAATTIDSATRLFRYTLQELGGTASFLPFCALRNRYVATFVAVLLGGALAASRVQRPDGTWTDYGTGGNLLWPLFGAGNQLLVGLTLLVGAAYLWKRRAPTLYLLLPAIVMLVIPVWAMLLNIFTPNTGWLAQKQYMLTGIGVVVILLAVWLCVEAAVALRKLTNINR